ncbi:MAG: hypothetical protein BRD55_01795 [Bacteroidetes bacterium SW_9_63_38]|nr:MAG: hypothetical protein BRD55_01795 [Bacteroidetes bacterium SW_9_63_38]
MVGGQQCLNETGLQHIGVVQPPEAHVLKRLRRYGDSLDEGENHATALAKERDVPLLIEERAGRRAARALGGESTGVAGLIDRARQQGDLSFSEARDRWRILLDNTESRRRCTGHSFGLNRAVRSY